MAVKIFRSTVSSKGQVTIPGPLRRRFGIDTGAVLEFEENKGQIVIRKAQFEDPVAAVTGIIREPIDVDAFIEERDWIRAALEPAGVESLAVTCEIDLRGVFPGSPNSRGIPPPRYPRVFLWIRQSE